MVYPIVPISKDVPLGRSREWGMFSGHPDGLPPHSVPGWCLSEVHQSLPRGGRSMSQTVRERKFSNSLTTSSTPHGCQFLLTASKGDSIQLYLGNNSLQTVIESWFQFLPHRVKYWGRYLWPASRHHPSLQVVAQATTVLSPSCYSSWK